MDTADAPLHDDEFAYDEFGLFHENIAEFELDVSEVPRVQRVTVEVPERTDTAAATGSDVATRTARRISALRWGDGPVEVVFVHGGAQNAHTWDTVVLALGRPALAVDLPGHGHSDWRADGAYTPANLADDIAVAVVEHAPTAHLVVGMSLGGLTSMELAVRHPDLVRRLVLVDITPGVNQQKAKAVLDFVDGPQEFASFDDLLKRTIEFNPTRSVSSLRRGILHNAARRPDGSWQWRYDRSSHVRSRDPEEAPASRVDQDGAGDDGARDSPAGDAGAAGDALAPTMSPLWEHFGAVAVPITLVRGATSPVVDDDDVAEARRRQPDLVVHVVEGAGHSVQGDRPVELAELLAGLLD